MGAFDQRSDVLGDLHDKTIKSIELAISFYSDIGDDETADAYMVFTEVTPATQLATPLTSSLYVECMSEGSNTAAATTIAKPQLPPVKATAPVDWKVNEFTAGQTTVSNALAIKIPVRGSPTTAPSIWSRCSISKLSVKSHGDVRSISHTYSESKKPFMDSAYVSSEIQATMFEYE